MPFWFLFLCTWPSFVLSESLWELPLSSGFWNITVLCHYPILWWSLCIWNPLSKFTWIFFPLIFSTQFSPFSLSGISIVQMLEILDQSSNYLFFLCSGSLSCCCIFWDLSCSPSVEGFVSAIMLLILKSLYPFLFSECSFQYNPVYVSWIQYLYLSIWGEL